MPPVTVLAVVALVAGSAAVLDQAVGFDLLLRYARRARLRAIPKGPTPPLSLIKPLYGADPGLEENLVATLKQNYPEFEVLFVHERPDGPALGAVDAATRAVPDVPVRRLAGRDPDAINPKVAVLVRGEAEARHELVASADSDVRRGGPDGRRLRAGRRRPARGGTARPRPQAGAPPHARRRVRGDGALGRALDADDPPRRAGRVRDRRAAHSGAAAARRLRRLDPVPRGRLRAARGAHPGARAGRRARRRPLLPRPVDAALAPPPAAAPDRGGGRDRGGRARTNRELARAAIPV
jgi:cellulose synthase/poly-beta-1,6-N-acetylglucosamine synthase-like glycosyltransferase